LTFAVFLTIVQFVRLLREDDESKNIPAPDVAELPLIIEFTMLGVEVPKYIPPPQETVAAEVALFLMLQLAMFGQEFEKKIPPPQEEEPPQQHPAPDAAVLSLTVQAVIVGKPPSQ
jgi:hypothetical protein